MGGTETRAEAMGRRGRQVAIQLYDWDKLIVPLDEHFQKSESFHSVNQIPLDFKTASKQVAGQNAELLFRLFQKITSKTREIAQEEGGGSLYRPYVYDTRDSVSNKVVGLKMGRRGGLARLATLKLSLPSDESVLILSIQNTRLPDSTPDLVFKADNEGITVARTEQSVEKDEKWLDKPFDEYLRVSLLEAQVVIPNLAL